MAAWLARVAALRPRWRYLALAGLGAVAGLGQAPFSLWPLTILALGAVLALVKDASGWRQASLMGLAAGWGYFALSLHWIVEPFFVDAARHAWMSPFALFFLALGMALFWALACGAAHRCGARSIAVIGAFILVEALRTYLFTGFPWAQLGHVLIPTWALAWSAWGGSLALTALVVLAACGVALAAQKRRAALPLLATALAIFAAAPLFTPEVPTPTEPRPTIRLIQPNAPQHLKWHPDYLQLFYDRQRAFTAEPPTGPAPDLIVWPETSVPVVLDRAEETLQAISRAANGTPVVLGIQRFEGLRYYNSLIRLGQVGEVTALYNKHHLVPFGEYMPFGDFFGRFGIDGLAANEGFGYSSGPGPVVIDMGALGTALPLICYEGVFPQDVGGYDRRPDFLLLITNDAWFGQIAGPYQHLAQARLRSAEQGLPMVRAANTGVSAMIDARGQITAQIPLNEAGWRDAALPPPLPPTFYATTGDAPIAALGLFLLFLSLLIKWPQSRRK